MEQTDKQIAEYRAEHFNAMLEYLVYTPNAQSLYFRQGWIPIPWYVNKFYNIITSWPIDHTDTPQDTYRCIEFPHIANGETQQFDQTKIEWPVSESTARKD